VDKIRLWKELKDERKSTIAKNADLPIKTKVGRIGAKGGAKRIRVATLK